MSRHFNTPRPIGIGHEWFREPAIRFLIMDLASNGREEMTVSLGRTKEMWYRTLTAENDKASDNDRFLAVCSEMSTGRLQECFKAGSEKRV